MKLHATERMRIAIDDAMDIHGGKAVIDGPQNYLGGLYRSVPVGITVEGANIMTRSLLIFGQGAILCHPWVMKEMQAAQNPDQRQGLEDFDRNLFGHIRYGISNAVRSFWFGITGAKFGAAPGDDGTGPGGFPPVGGVPAAGGYGLFLIGEVHKVGGCGVVPVLASGP